MIHADYRLSEDRSRYIIINADGKEIPLIAPRSYNHGINAIKDVVFVNDIPCYVYQNKEGKYSLRPALEGSGMAIDAYCYDIDSWGAYGDFEKITCKCGYEWYMNVRKIPQSDKYEVKCPECEALLMRKKGCFSILL